MGRSSRTGAYLHGYFVIFFDFSPTQNDEIILETPDIPISRPAPDPALNAIPSSQTVEGDTPIAPLPFMSTPLYFFHSPTPAPNLTVSSSGTAKDYASIVPLPIGLPPSEFFSSPTLGSRSLPYRLIWSQFLRVQQKMRAILKARPAVL